MQRYLSVLGLCLATGFSYASEMVIYPAEGQSAEQQQKDEGECIVWAKQQSGFDPLAKAPAPNATADANRRGGAVRGAAGGAAVGAIVGDSDDAAKGAAAGAVLGKMRQNRENRRAAQTNQASTQAAQNVQNQGREKFDRAYGACLKGRGYSIN
jgi:hypothetical protein